MTERSRCSLVVRSSSRACRSDAVHLRDHPERHGRLRSIVPDRLPAQQLERSAADSLLCVAGPEHAEARRERAGRGVDERDRERRRNRRLLEQPFAEVAEPDCPGRREGRAVQQRDALAQLRLVRLHP